MFIHPETDAFEESHDASAEFEYVDDMPSADQLVFGEYSTNLEEEEEEEEIDYDDTIIYEEMRVLKNIKD